MFATQKLLPICEISRSSFFFPLIETPSSIPFKKDVSNTWNRLKILQAMNFWQQKINKRKRLVPLQNFEMSYTKIDLFFIFFLQKIGSICNVSCFLLRLLKGSFPSFGNFFQKWDCWFWKYFGQRLFGRVIVVNFIYRWRRAPGPMQALMSWSFSISWSYA